MAQNDAVETTEMTDRSAATLERAVVRLLERATVDPTTGELCFPVVESRDYEGATVDLWELPNEDVLIEALWQAHGCVDPETLAPLPGDATKTAEEIVAERKQAAAEQGEEYLTVRERIARWKARKAAEAAGTVAPAANAAPVERQRDGSTGRFVATAKPAAAGAAPQSFAPQAGTMTLEQVAAMLEKATGKPHAVKNGAVIPVEAVA